MVSVMESLQIDTSDVTKGSYMYIACMYDRDLVWLVEEISEEFGDFFFYKVHASQCWEVGLFFLKRVSTIEPPNLTSGSGRYSISEESKTKAEKPHTLWERTLK